MLLKEKHMTVENSLNIHIFWTIAHHKYREEQFSYFKHFQVVITYKKDKDKAE